MERVFEFVAQVCEGVKLFPGNRRAHEIHDSPGRRRWRPRSCLRGFTEASVAGEVLSGSGWSWSSNMAARAVMQTPKPSSNKFKLTESRRNKQLTMLCRVHTRICAVASYGAGDTLFFYVMHLSSENVTTVCALSVWPESSYPRQYGVRVGPYDNGVNKDALRAKPVANAKCSSSSRWVSPRFK